MFKRMLFVMLIITLFFSLVVVAQAQEKKEVPKKVLKLVDKAIEDMKEQKVDKAMEKLAEAKELAPDYAPIYVQYALISQKQQNLDEALVHMTKAYELDPSSDSISHQYAVLLLQSAQQKMGQQDMAATLAFYEKFAAIPGIKAKMSSQFVQVTYTLAGNYVQAGKPDKVILYANEMLSTPGVESFPQQNLFAYFLLGSAYGQMKENDKSIENLKKFLELNHDNLAPVQFVSMSNFLIASTHFVRLEEKIKTMKPEDLEGIKKYSEEQVEMVTYLNAALVADPQNQDAKFYLAKYNYYIQNYDAAIAMLNELLTTSPDNGDYKKSLDIVNRALEASKAAAKDTSKNKKK